MAEAKLTAKGQLVIRPATRDVRELKSILPRPKKTASLADMDQAIRRRAGSMP